MNVRVANAATASARHAEDSQDDVFGVFSEAYERERREAMSLAEYLEACRSNPGMYATAAERMVTAIGEPKIIDTSADLRLGRVFLNRTIKVYPTMAGFFGMEETIQRRGSRSASKCFICSAQWAAANRRSPSG
jgi:predicted Ser/Thr protein kinase